MLKTKAGNKADKIPKTIHKLPVDFMHLHTDFKSSSVIDHFFVNQRLLENIEDAGLGGLA